MQILYDALAYLCRGCSTRQRNPELYHEEFLQNRLNIIVNHVSNGHRLLESDSGFVLTVLRYVARTTY